jgi:hypothetical protein
MGRGKENHASYNRTWREYKSRDSRRAGEQASRQEDDSWDDGLGGVMTPDSMIVIIVIVVGVE